MADDPRTDAELVDAVRRGDGGAFATLYLRHRDWAFRVARRFVADDGLAMDAVQEAFLYLHRKGRGLRLTARFTTFLYPVVRHEAQRAARNARRGHGSTSPERKLGVTPPDPAIPPRDRPTDEDLAHLHRALAALPDPQREALLMSAVDGMTHGEIAIALGIPLGTVKSRLHAALGTLRENPRLAAWFVR